MLETIASFDFHPPLASFPFALLSVVVILEIILLFHKSDYIRNAISVNISILAITVIATFFSGLRAESMHKTEDPNLRAVIEYHYNLGRVLLFFTLACVCSYIAAIKARHLKIFFMISYYLILLLCFSLVLLTGYIGANLVFHHGVGVEKTI